MVALHVFRQLSSEAMGLNFPACQTPSGTERALYMLEKPIVCAFLVIRRVDKNPGLCVKLFEARKKKRFKI